MHWKDILRAVDTLEAPASNHLLAPLPITETTRRNAGDAVRALAGAAVPLPELTATADGGVALAWDAVGRDGAGRVEVVFVEHRVDYAVERAADAEMLVEGEATDIAAVLHDVVLRYVAPVR